MPKKFPTPNYKGESSDESVCILDDGQDQDRKNAAMAYKKAVERHQKAAKKQAAEQTVSRFEKFGPETRDFRLRNYKSKSGATMSDSTQLAEVSGNSSPLLGDNNAANRAERWWNSEGVVLNRRRARNCCEYLFAKARDYRKDLARLIMMVLALGTFIIAWKHLTKAQEAAEMQAKILDHLTRQ